MVLVNLYESYRLASACSFKRCFYIIHNSYVQELKREKRMGPLKYLYMRGILKMLSGKDLIAVSEGVAKELNLRCLLRNLSILFTIPVISVLSSHNRLRAYLLMLLKSIFYTLAEPQRRNATMYFSKQ